MNNKLAKVLLASALVLPGVAPIATNVASVSAEEVEVVSLETDGYEESYVSVIDQVVRHRTEDNASAVAFLEEGEKATFLGAVDNKWFKVEVNGQKGFVLRGNVTSQENYDSEDTTLFPLETNKTQDEEQYTVAVKTSLRTGNAERFRSLKVMDRGDEVDYLGTTKDGNWFKVKHGEITGFVDRAEVTTKENFGAGSEAESLSLYTEDSMTNTLEVMIDSAIRTQAGKQYRVIDEVVRNEKVEYLGTVENNKSWFKVKTEDDKEGYIYRGDVTKFEEEELILTNASAINSTSFEAYFKNSEGTTIPVTIELDKAHYGVQDITFEHEGKEYTVEVAFETEDNVKANETIAKIDGLPYEGDVELSDKEAIEDARKSYDALTDTQKEKIDNVKRLKLINLEKRIANIEEKESNFNNAKELIASIPSSIKKVTLEHKETVDSAREAYDKLTEDQKESLRNLDDDFSNNYLGHLLNAESKVDELHQEKGKDMFSEFVIRQTAKQWSIEFKFHELKMNEVDALTIVLFDGERKIGEQEATEKTLNLEKTGVSSPFYFDGSSDNYWTIAKELLSGTPDKAVITFEVDGEAYIVENFTSDIK